MKQIDETWIDSEIEFKNKEKKAIEAEGKDGIFYRNIYRKLEIEIEILERVKKQLK